MLHWSNARMYQKKVLPKLLFSNVSSRHVKIGKKLVICSSFEAELPRGELLNYLDESLV